MSTLQVKRMKAQKRFYVFSKTHVGSSQTFLKACFPQPSSYIYCSVSFLLVA